MTKYYLHHPIYSMLLVFIFFTSCNAQNKVQPQQIVSKPKAITGEQPKIVKTQGTDQYSNVHCALQDKVGNFWFGTTGEGVYRYDGKSFINFTKKDGLSSNYVYSVLEDKAGSIWFGTKAGLCRYDGKAITGVSISVANRVNSPGVWCMLQDKTGELWFCTGDGVFLYNGKSFTRFLDNNGIINKDGLNLKQVSSMMEDKTGNIWFTTWFEGVCRYDGKSIISFKPNGEVWFATIFEDKSGSIWIGRRSNGVCRYNGKTFTNSFTSTETFNSCCVQAIAEDKWGNIWFGTEFSNLGTRENFGGVWCYNPPTSLTPSINTFSNFTMKDGLSNNGVFCILQDKSGNLWFGTRGMGLCRYDGKAFTSFSE